MYQLNLAIRTLLAISAKNNFNRAEAEAIMQGVQEGMRGK